MSEERKFRERKKIVNYTSSTTRRMVGLYVNETPEQRKIRLEKNRLSSKLRTERKKEKKRIRDEKVRQRILQKKLEKLNDQKILNIEKEESESDGAELEQRIKQKQIPKRKLNKITKLKNEHQEEFLNELSKVRHLSYHLLKRKKWDKEEKSIEELEEERLKARREGKIIRDSYFNSLTSEEKERVLNKRKEYLLKTKFKNENETLEQKQERFRNYRKKYKDKILSLSNEERDQYMKNMKEITKRKKEESKAKMTLEEWEAFRERTRMYNLERKLRLEAMGPPTPEEREKILAKRREYARVHREKVLANETEEQKLIRLEKEKRIKQRNLAKEQKSNIINNDFSTGGSTMDLISGIISKFNYNSNRKRGGFVSNMDPKRERALFLKRESTKRRREKNRFDCIEYWKNKGFNEIEALQKAKESKYIIPKYEKIQNENAAVIKVETVVNFNNINEKKDTFINNNNTTTTTIVPQLNNFDSDFLSAFKIQHVDKLNGFEVNSKKKEIKPNLINIKKISNANIKDFDSWMQFLNQINTEVPEHLIQTCNDLQLTQNEIKKVRRNYREYVRLYKRKVEKCLDEGIEPPQYKEYKFRGLKTADKKYHIKNDPHHNKDFVISSCLNDSINENQEFINNICEPMCYKEPMGNAKAVFLEGVKLNI